MDINEIISKGFKDTGMYYTKGSQLLIEVNNKWYQVHLNPYTLQTEKVEIKSLSEITPNREYEPSYVHIQRDEKKPKGKHLLPSYMVKKSDKWYENTNDGKFWKTEYVEKKWIMP